MKNLSAQLQSAFSALPTASAAYQGAIIRLTTDNKPYWCDGSSWVDLTLTGSGGSSMVVRDEAAAVVTAPTAISFVGDGVAASLANSTEAKVQIDDAFFKPTLTKSTTYNTYVDSKLMAAGNGIVVYANGNSATTPVCWRTKAGTDGWAISTSTYPSTFSPTALTYGNGRFIVMGTVSSVTNLMYSTDANTWTTITSPCTNAASLMPFGNGRFVLVDNTTKVPYSSVDGISWEVGDMFSEAPLAVIFARGKFYAYLSVASTMYTSQNGLTWTLLGSVTGGSFSGAVVDHNGTFVNPGGVSTGVVTSQDGLALSSATPAVWASTIAIMYGNTVFTGGGYVFAVDRANGKVLYSPDGLAWSSMSLPANATPTCGVYYEGPVYFGPYSGATYGFFYTTRVTDPSRYTAYEGGEPIDLVNSPAVTAPRSNTARLYGRTIANRSFPAFIGVSNMDSVVQPSIWRQKVACWNPPGNATTLPGVDGMNAPTALGTATTRAVATTNLLTRTRRLCYASAATAAAFCGHYGTLAQWTTGTGACLGGFFYSCRFAITDPAAVTGARMFIGMRNLVAAPTNVEPNTLANHIGITQLSNDATQLQFICRGAADGSTTPLGTNFPPMAGVGATNGIVYDLTIYSSPNDNGAVTMRLERLGTSYVVEQKYSGGHDLLPAQQRAADPRCVAHQQRHAVGLRVGHYQRLYRN